MNEPGKDMAYERTGLASAARPGPEELKTARGVIMLYYKIM